MKAVEQLPLFLEDKSGTVSNYAREKIAGRRTMTLNTCGKLVI
jgi:hypothetical protein